MPYGKPFARLEQAADGNELVIRVKLPESGEPARSGRSDNLTNPKEWAEVVDEFGMPTGIKFSLTVCAPYRREVRRYRERLVALSMAPRLVNRRPM